MLGIPVPTIRSWERRYGFPAPARTGGRHRRYGAHEVAALREVRDRITRGERAGHAIRSVQAEGPRDERPTDPALDAFGTAAATLDQRALHDVLRDAEARLGTDRAIVEVALPGMRAVGTSWHAGELDVAAEHAATTTVRAWLAGLLPRRVPPLGPPVVLACPRGEQHTLGLEALDVLLARRGVATLLLGANTPTHSLADAVRSARARVAVVTAHRAVVRRPAIEALGELARLRRAPYYAGNAFATPRSRADAPGTYLGEDLLDAMEIVCEATR
jgi:DNA-binding transcriptional MerR regulator